MEFVKLVEIILQRQTQYSDSCYFCSEIQKCIASERGELCVRHRKAFLVWQCQPLYSQMGDSIHARIKQLQR